MDRFKAALALLAIWTGAALAQVTISTPVLNFPSGQNVQRVYSQDGYLAYRNTVGQIPNYVQRNVNLNVNQTVNVVLKDAWFVSGMVTLLTAHKLRVALGAYEFTVVTVVSIAATLLTATIRRNG